MEREGALQRERIELSQSIHDTTAQSAYMIGLGIDAAKRLAGDSNAELTARLEATSRLSKTAIWQLRHPIDMGGIFDGRELGRTLGSHVAAFTAITAVPADLVQNGQGRSFRWKPRACCSRSPITRSPTPFAMRRPVGCWWNWTSGRTMSACRCRTTASGLPEDYAERGHGFANMRTDAERLGGRLMVEPRGPAGGARVTCVMPLVRNRKEA